jgi:predicted Zn-dependent peptidase
VSTGAIGTEFPDDGTGAVRRTVLPGGLRVITEALPAVRSAAFGIWAGVGSRDEAPTHAGATHYLEHLLFKGTRRRTALEISATMDAVGGELNAFTGKEYTCYYARVLDADLPLAISVLSDMVTDSLIASKDVDAERGVILEEIAMNEDDPSDTVHEAFARQLFGDTPLGRPILGTVDSINAITRDQIAEHYRARYTPDHLVVAAAGSLDHDAVVRHVQQAFGHVLEGRRQPAPPRLAGEGGAVASGRGVRLVSRGIEQANLVLGCTGLRRTDERRFALGVLNSALGGGMSSRLFQEAREKRGLCYSIYSYHAAYTDVGMFALYAGTDAADAADLMRLAVDEITSAAETISEAEVARAKAQMKAGLLMALESSGQRIAQLAHHMLTFGRPIPLNELVEKVDAVTVESARAAGRALIRRGKPAIALLGLGSGLESAVAIAETLNRQAA